MFRLFANHVELDPLSKLVINLPIHLKAALVFFGIWNTFNTKSRDVLGHPQLLRDFPKTKRFGKGKME